MTIRRRVRNFLFRISPRLGAGFAALWDVVVSVPSRMSVRAAIKYTIWGLCPGISGRFTYFGTRVYFPTGSAVFKLACESKVYEPDVTAWLCRLVEPDHVFIDIGANIGLTSIPVLRTVPRSRVFSFEPSPNSLPYLEKTRQESGLGARWEIIGKAAAESVGTCQFWVSEAQFGGWDGLKDTKREGDRHAIEVPQTTLDTEWRRLDRPRVSCIKIDVEGAEIRVLKGAEELVRRDRPYVLLEWNEQNLSAYGTSVDALLDYAYSHDYELVAFPGLNPIRESHVLRLHMLGSEMFLLVSNRATVPSRAASTPRSVCAQVGTTV